MASQKKTPDTEFGSAERRKQHLEALRHEREGYKRAGNADRLADVDAEIKRVAGSPRGTGGKPAGNNTASTAPNQA